MDSKVWLVLALCFLGFAVFKANVAIRIVLNSNAPAFTKYFLVMASIGTCLIPVLWGEAERFVADHLRKKGYRRGGE